MAGGLYVIWLSDTHYYGGRTVNFKVRWQTHANLLRKGFHTNPHAQAVYNIHGRFEPKILCEIPESEQRAAEDAWLAEHFGKPDCVNVWNSSEGMPAGWRHSDATKAKFKARRFSDETKHRWSESRKGHQVSDATRQKLSSSLRGKERPDVADRNVKSTGWKHTDDAKAKISAAGARVHSESSRAKVKATHKELGIRPPSRQGTTHTDDSRQKMSESHKGPRINMSHEEHTRRSEAIKAAWGKRKASKEPK